MKNELVFRRMTNEDAPAVVQILASFLSDRTISEHAGAYGGSGSISAIRSALKLLLTKPNLGFVWLAAELREIAGLAVVCFAVSTNTGGVVAKIPDLVVREDRRGSGVGTALVTSLANELKDAGIQRIDLGVHDTNAEARKFYARLGFQHNHEIGMSLVL